MVVTTSHTRQLTMATKKSLTDVQRRLLKLMQRINYGRIHGLTVRGGQPHFDSPPRIVRSIKSSRWASGRGRLSEPNFSLKAKVIELFVTLEALDNAMVEMLEVRDGLPVHMTILDA